MENFEEVVMSKTNYDKNEDDLETFEFVQHVPLNEFDKLDPPTDEEEEEETSIQRVSKVKMLQIQLSKRGLGSEGGTSTPKISGSDNVTVSYPDHLVLADLSVAKGLASPSNLNLNVKAAKTIGRKHKEDREIRSMFASSVIFPLPSMAN